MITSHRSGSFASRVNSVTTFTCNDGFQLAGSSRRTCQKNGGWSGTPAVCTRELLKATMTLGQKSTLANNIFTKTSLTFILAIAHFD